MQRSPTLRLTKTWRLEPKISNLNSSDQNKDFHRSNVHCSCFLAQASIFLLLVSFSSGSLQQFDHGLIHAGSSEQLMLRCVCYLNSIIRTWSLPNRAIFCIPPLPCHNTTDWLKRIKKERHFTNYLLTRHTC